MVVRIAVPEPRPWPPGEEGCYGFQVLDVADCCFVLLHEPCVQPLNLSAMLIDVVRVQQAVAAVEVAFLGMHGLLDAHDDKQVLFRHSPDSIAGLPGVDVALQTLWARVRQSNGSG
jgi:hypothetical protein